jgi:hypothetical protein
MARNVGIWLDYTECIVSFPDEGHYIRRIMSRAGLRIRQTENGKSVAVEGRDPRVNVRLNQYYTEIINSVHSADAILLFGPDGAKSELQEQMLKAQMGERILAVEDSTKKNLSQVISMIHDAFEGHAVPTRVS